MKASLALLVIESQWDNMEEGRTVTSMTAQSKIFPSRPYCFAFVAIFFPTNDTLGRFHKWSWHHLMCRVRSRRGSKISPFPLSCFGSISPPIVNAPNWEHVNNILPVPATPPKIDSKMLAFVTCERSFRKTKKIDNRKRRTKRIPNYFPTRS